MYTRQADRYMEIRSVAELRCAEDAPSGLTEPERKRLKDLWSITRPTTNQRREMRALQARMKG